MRKVKMDDGKLSLAPTAHLCMLEENKSLLQNKRREKC